MKPNLFVTPLWATLLFFVYLSAHAATGPAPQHYYHNFLASDGKRTVSNQDGILRYSGLDLQGRAVANAPIDSKGTCLAGAGGVFINSVKYVEAVKLFVAVGYANAPSNLPPNTVSAEQPTQSWFCNSTDGITWNSAAMDNSTDPLRMERFNDVDYGNGYFVAVGQNGDKALVKVLQANRGDDLTTKTWTAIQTADGDNAGYPINSVAFGTSKFVAAANDSSIYLFVPPGTPANGSSRWVSNRAGNISGSANFNQVIYVKDLKMLVLIGDKSTVWYSIAGDEGVIWESAQMPTRYGMYNRANLNQITYANNTFVIVADAGTVFQSTNGTNWNAAEGLKSTTNFTRISYSPPEFKAFGVYPKIETWYSYNGQKWSQDAVPPMFVKNDQLYQIYVCTLQKGQPNSEQRCSGTTNKGFFVELGSDFQPRGGFQTGDQICVAAFVSGLFGAAYASYYFTLQKPAYNYESQIVLTVKDFADISQYYPWPIGFDYSQDFLLKVKPVEGKSSGYGTYCYTALP